MGVHESVLADTLRQSIESVHITVTMIDEQQKKIVVMQNERLDRAVAELQSILHHYTLPHLKPPKRKNNGERKNDEG